MLGKSTWRGTEQAAVRCLVRPLGDSQQEGMALSPNHKEITATGVSLEAESPVSRQEWSQHPDCSLVRP